MLPLQELDTPPLNLNATAFLYINTNPNALQVNPSLNVSAPMRRDKQPSVWSWLPEDTVNITSELCSMGIFIPRSYESERRGLP